MIIHVRANEVWDNGNGTFSIDIPSAPIDPKDAAVLEKLYPRLFNEAETLLAREALLDSFATPAEVHAPATRERKKVRKSAQVDESVS